MKAWRNGRKEWTARFAALLLVVQAVMLAFSTGATAEPVLRDQFGNVICAPSAGGGHGGPTLPDRHAGGFDCCTIGCPMLGGLEPAAALNLSVFGRPLVASVSFAFHVNDAAAGVPPSPRNAQGPPLSA